MRELLGSWCNPSAGDELARAPDHVKRNLDRAASAPAAFLPRGSGQGWEEVLSSIVVDGPTLTAAAEALLVPDFNIPANYMTVGRTIKYTTMFRWSTAITTPGTLTLRERWGGLAGVSMVASGAFAPDPTAAATNLTCFAEFWTVQRTVGTSGTSMTIGRVTWNDYDDATVATIVGNLNMEMMPTSAPAVATVDTTVVKALSLTAQPSVATGSVTAHIAILESMN